MGLTCTGSKQYLGLLFENLFFVGNTCFPPTSACGSIVGSCDKKSGQFFCHLMGHIEDTAALRVLAL